LAHYNFELTAGRRAFQHRLDFGPQTFSSRGCERLKIPE
jgi:hypothetical protein